MCGTLALPVAVAVVDVETELVMEMHVASVAAVVSVGFEVFVEFSVGSVVFVVSADCVVSVSAVCVVVEMH